MCIVSSTPGTFCGYVCYWKNTHLGDHYVFLNGVRDTTAGGVDVRKCQMASRNKSRNEAKEQTALVTFKAWF